MPLTFLDGLGADLRSSVMDRLRDLWTHGSTAIEGNSLSLGETAFLLREGLTVSGKPLKDHQEVVGHAKAIDLLQSMLGGLPITEANLFLLHKAVQCDRVLDVYAPLGSWKVEYNGTYHTTDDGQQLFLEYASPVDTPTLMTHWLVDLNVAMSRSPLDRNGCLEAYASLHAAFVRIHPFADGNGRMARLLANLPVLKSGLPPILIAKETRFEYIRLLSRYERSVGIPTQESQLSPVNAIFSEFKEFLAKQWQASWQIIEEARNAQLLRLP